MRRVNQYLFDQTKLLQDHIYNSPTKLNMAALILPTLSPKLSRPAASAERVTVKLSHERTGDEKRREIVSVSAHARTQARTQACLVGSLRKPRPLTSTLIGEKHLGFHSHWQSDTLSSRPLKERLS